MSRLFSRALVAAAGAIAITAGSAVPLAYAAALPVVSSVSPTSGNALGGTSVTVTGANFTGATAATFGTTKGSTLVVVSSSKITVTSPAHTAGRVDVRIVTRAGTSKIVSADRFTFVDTTPPGPVTGVTATVSGTRVGLNWVNPTDKDFNGVVIRRAAGPTPPATPTDGTPLTTTAKTATAYTDTSASATTQYSYALFSRDTSGNTAAAAATTLTTTTTDTTPPAPVTAVTTTLSGTSIGLQWTNPADADFYGVTIRRAVGTVAPSSPTAGTLVATTSKTATSYINKGLAAGTTYTYALFAHDVVPNYATRAVSAAVKTASAKDTTRPGPVSGVTARPTQNTVTLSWVNPTASDFFGVMIRRANGATPPSSATAGTLVADTNKGVTSVTDTSLSPSSQYSYALFAHDAAPNYATRVATTTTTLAGVDTTPPGPVTSLTAVPTAGSVALTWVDPTDADLAGVMIRRSIGATPPSSPTAGTLVTDTVGTATAFTDSGLSASTQYSYALFAHDAVPNYATGTATTVTTTAPPDTTPPGPVTALTATAGVTSVALSWTNPADADFAGVMIRRAAGPTPPSSPTAGTLVTDAAKPATSFTDSGLSSSTQYSYALFAHDAVPNYAAGSTQTVTTIAAPDTTPPGPVTALTATATAGAVTLSWTDPTDADFTGVMIRRAQGATPPSSPTAGTLVVDAAKPASSFTDSGLTASTQYSYALFAHDAVPNYATATTKTITTAAPPDTTPPGPVTGVTVMAAPTSIALSWTNPSDTDFAGVMIRRAQGATAPTATTGTLVARVTKPGTGYTDTGLTAATQYSYALFAYDGVPNYSSAATKSVTTQTVQPGSCTATWTGAVDSSFSTAGNWDTGAVPGTADWACIPTGAKNLPVTVFDTEQITGLTNAGGLSVSGYLTLQSPTVRSTSAGPLTVNGTLAVGDDLQLSGQTVVAGGTFAGPGTVTNTSSATVTVSPDTQLYLDHATLVNNGSMSFAVGSMIDGSCYVAATDTQPAVTAGELDNAGSITTNGTSTSPVLLGYWNDCLVTHDSGALTVASGEVDLNGAAFGVDTGATVTGASGARLVVGNRVSFDAASTTLPIPVVVSGQATGSGNVTASAGLTLSGSLNGSGTWTVPAGASLSLNGGNIDSGTLVNNGTGSVVADTRPWVGNNAKLVNRGSLSFAVGSMLDGACYQSATDTQPAVPAGEFDNTGSITTNGTSTSPVQLGYYDDCLVTQDSGSLTVASGEADLNGSSFNVNTGATVTGASSATLVVGNQVTFNAASTTLPIPVVVSGQATGAGNVTASAGLTLSGSLNGSGSWTVPAGSSLSLNGGNIDSGTLVNNGTGSVVADTRPWVGNNARLVNSGSLSFAVGSMIDGACYQSATDTQPAVPAGELDNTGSITTNGTSTSPVQLGYYDDCLVTQDSGSLTVASGEVDLNGSAFNVNTGATVTGASSATLVIGNRVSFNAASTTLPVPVVVSGQATGAGNVTASASLTVSGSLNGTGTWTAPTSLRLDGGYVNSGSLVNSGTGSVDADTEAWIGNSATLVNRGSLSFAVGSMLGGACYQSATDTQAAVPAGEFDNTGSITTNGTSTSPVQFGYWTDCLVTQDSGSLTVASGEADLNGSSFNINTGATVTGASSARLVIGSTVSFNAASTTLPIPVAVSGQATGVGNVTASAALTVSGSFNGTGTWTVPSAASLTFNGGNINSGAVVNNGTGTVTADTEPWVGNAAKLVNNGSLSFAIGSMLGGACYQSASDTQPAVPAGEFDNTGSITTNGTSTSPVQLGYWNDCLVTEDSGSLTVASGELDLNGANFDINAGATVTGASSARLVIGSTVSFNAASTTLPFPAVVSGSATGSGNVTASSSLTVSGSLNGSGTWTVPAGASLTLNGGDINSGSLVNNGTGSVSADTEPWVGNAAKLVNNGSLSFAVGSMLGGACYQSASDTQAAVPAGEFDNTGSIVTNGTSSSPVRLGYWNACLLTQDSGSLTVASGEVDLSGSTFTFATGATVTGSSSARLVVDGAVSSNLAGVGSLGSVVDEGDLVVHRSLSLPALTLSGTLELAPGVTVTTPSAAMTGGTLQVDAAGPGQFGHLAVSGTTSASNLTLFMQTGSYTPVCGASLTALQAGSVTAGFSWVSGSTLPDTGSWTATSSSTSAGAYVYCPPPPAPVAQSYGGGIGVDGVNPSGYFAEPVNTGSGAYTTTETDVHLPGLGVPLVMSRSYTSNDPYSGPMGPGWTFSLNAFVTGGGGGSATVTAGDGQVTTYTPNGDGSYTAAAGARSVLSDRSGGGWLLVRQDQEHLVFDSSGRLTSWVDRNGVGLTLTYDGSGRLATVKDYAGHVASFTYNAAGLLASVSFPAGRSVSYGYDSSGNLTSATDAAGGVTSYGYDASGLLATITDPAGHHVVSNTYDSGRVVSQVNARGKTTTFAWDAGTQTCTITTPNGGAWKDVYSGTVLLQRVDPLGDVTSYAYDGDMNRTAVTDGDGHTTTMSYNAAGDLLTRTAPSPLSTTESWTYDGLNDVTSYTNGRGATTTFAYDGHGNLLKTVRPDGSTVTQTADPTTGALTSRTDERGKTTTFGYDAAGQLTSVTDPASDTTAYGYDAAGRRTTQKDPAGKTTTTAYDALDRVTSVTDPNGHSTQYGYDAVGNRTSVTDPDGHTTGYAYDADNELTIVTAPGGATTTTAYDGDGNKISVTDGNGHARSYGYDSADRMTSATDPLGNKTSYGYDAAGNRTSTKDAAGATTTDAYDALNRLAGVTYSDGTPAVSYSYDADGNRTGMTDGTGTTTYTYNSRDELTSVTSPQGSFSYGYDPAGHITGRTTPDGVAAAEGYDAAGRLTSLAVDGHTIGYGYDADSRLTAATLPNGVTESRTYDAASQTTAVTDAASGATLSAYQYAYDAAANPTTVTVNGEADAYTYDNRNELTKVCYAASCGNGSITWAYDPAGNRSSENRTGSAPSSTTYAYNGGDQLTSSTSGGTTTSNGYDADGRLTSSGSTTYTYNAAHELTKVVQNGVTTTYTYTGDGLRASASSNGTTTVFAYDVNNPLPELATEKSGASFVRRYTWAFGALQVLRENGADFYAGHDRLGSTVTLTDSAGTVQRTASYEPFGLVHSSTSASGAPVNPLGWESEYQDATGLDQLQARYLNPATGTFTEQDPLAQPETQVHLSDYLYANNQPTTYVDPSGMRCTDATDAQIARYMDYARYEVNPFAGSGMFGSSDAYTSAGDTAYDIATSTADSPLLSASSTVVSGVFAIKDIHDISEQEGRIQDAANRDLN